MVNSWQPELVLRSGVSFEDIVSVCGKTQPELCVEILALKTEAMERVVSAKDVQVLGDFFTNDLLLKSVGNANANASNSG